MSSTGGNHLPTFRTIRTRTPGVITRLRRHDCHNGEWGGPFYSKAKEFCSAGEPAPSRRCAPLFSLLPPTATRPRCSDSHSSFRRSHHRDLGIIIHSAGNVTVLHAEKRCLLEQKHHSWTGREWRTGVAHGEHWMQEIVTYGGSRVSLNRDVNCEPHDVL